jgi:hypothetical protein
VGARGIDFEQIAQSGVGNQFAENALRSWQKSAVDC